MFSSFLCLDHFVLNRYQQLHYQIDPEYLFSPENGAGKMERSIVEEFFQVNYTSNFNVGRITRPGKIFYFHCWIIINTEYTDDDDSFFILNAQQRQLNLCIKPMDQLRLTEQSIDAIYSCISIDWHPILISNYVNWHHEMVQEVIRVWITYQ